MRLFSAAPRAAECIMWRLLRLALITADPSSLQQPDKVQAAFPCMPGGQTPSMNKLNS